MRTSRHGFTLIELSIVLVIIGLLVGGVIVGRSIVRNSNLQTIVTDTTRYINAAAQFQKKYNSLPGDMADATATWGTNATCAANGAGTGTQTCNGNGDGKVYDYPTYGLSDATNNMERYLFWQHLANAGLISGSFTGVSGYASNGYTNINGTNIPASAVEGGGYDWGFMGRQNGSPDYFDNSYGHIMYFAADQRRNISQGPVLSGAEAYALDSKMDDGKPGSGKIYGSPLGATNAGTCSTSASVTTATYDLTRGGALTCALLIMTGF